MSGIKRDVAERLYPPPRPTTDFLELQRRINDLSPADRLRVCAELLDAGKRELAETLLGNVIDELRGLRLLLRKEFTP
jgi:hypothetical protein